MGDTLERWQVKPVGHVQVDVLLMRAINHKLDALLEQQEKYMSELFDAITAAADATGAKADAAANRVIATINANNAVVAAMQEHNTADDAAIADLQAQLAAGTPPDPAAVQAVVDKLVAVQGKIDSIDAEPVPSL